MNSGRTLDLIIVFNCNTDVKFPVPLFLQRVVEQLDVL
jgi:hypothetical protein